MLFDWIRGKSTTKEKIQQDFSFLSTDMHSHLIPGIDDGSDSPETSVKLVQHLYDLGFRKLITTPHVMIDHYPNTTDSITKGFAVLKAAVEAAQIPVELGFAAEYYMDEVFEKKLGVEPLLTISDNKILVEMSFMAAPRNLQQIIFKIRTQGYKPVLAHPERYVFWANDFEQFENLKELGCDFQLNLLSILGYYGKASRDLGLKFLDAGMINLVGTDLHHERHAKALQDLSKDNKLMKILANQPNLYNLSL